MTSILIFSETWKMREILAPPALARLSAISHPGQLLQGRLFCLSQASCLLFFSMDQRQKIFEPTGNDIYFDL